MGSRGSRNQGGSALTQLTAQQIGKALNAASLLEIDDVIDGIEFRERIIIVLAVTGDEKRMPKKHICRCLEFSSVEIFVVL